MKNMICHVDSPLWAKATENYLKGGMNRRDFLRLSAAAGISLASPAFLAGCSQSPSRKVESKTTDLLGPQSAFDPRTDQHKFLAEMGKRFSGTTLRVVIEDTPPANAVKQLINKEFTPVSGIQVDWELLPLDRVFAKIVSNTTQQAGFHDLFYVDQGWIGRFYKHFVPPGKMLANHDLAYPGYDFDDFLQPLLDHVASYNGVMAAVPFDIPIYITMYRKDILDEMGFLPPTTLEEYMDVAKAVTDAKAPHIYGTVASWQSGHYGLECSMTSWLWAHGGSIFGRDGKALINDDRAFKAMSYMLELKKQMPPNVTNLDWYGEIDHFIQGKTAILTSWSEYFSNFDDPGQSKIAGLAQAAPCPIADRLRTPDECGFGEVPGVSHQGGSSLAISRYSKNIDAAWVFLQWATSSDVTTRACLLSGGGNHVRNSNFSDERIKANATVKKGTTRHFDVALDAILNRMGTEPHLPGWTDLAVNIFAVELGKMMTKQQGIEETLSNMHRAAQASAALALES